jgi:uncharacterized protein YjbJ (UPF0337 family)
MSSWGVPAAKRGKIAASAVDTREGAMSSEDKINNKVEEVVGKVKDRVGGATGDRDLQAEGQADQSVSNLKQAGEKVKDAFKS